MIKDIGQNRQKWLTRGVRHLQNQKKVNVMINHKTKLLAEITLLLVSR